MSQLETQLIQSLQQLSEQHSTQVNLLTKQLTQQAQHYDESLQKLATVQRTQSEQIENLSKHVRLLLKQFQE